MRDPLMCSLFPTRDHLICPFVPTRDHLSCPFLPTRDHLLPFHLAGVTTFHIAEISHMAGSSTIRIMIILHMLEYSTPTLTLRSQNMYYFLFRPRNFKLKFSLPFDAVPDISKACPLAFSLKLVSSIPILAFQTCFLDSDPAISNLLPIRHHNHLSVSIHSVFLFHYPFCSSNSKILYHKSCHSGL